jgi:hypothetical protein
LPAEKIKIASPCPGSNDSSAQTRNGKSNKPPHRQSPETELTKPENRYN